MHLFKHTIFLAFRPHTHSVGTQNIYIQSVCRYTSPLVHVAYYIIQRVCLCRCTARPEAWARRGRVINNVRLFEINFNEEGDCCDLDKHGVGGSTSGGGRAGLARRSVGRSVGRDGRVVMVVMGGGPEGFSLGSGRRALIMHAGG